MESKVWLTGVKALGSGKPQRTRKSEVRERGCEHHLSRENTAGARSSPRRATLFLRARTNPPRARSAAVVPFGTTRVAFWYARANSYDRGVTLRRQYQIAFPVPSFILPPLLHTCGKNYPPSTAVAAGYRQFSSAASGQYLRIFPLPQDPPAGSDRPRAHGSDA